MKLYKYKNYQEYKEKQIDGYKKKEKNSWVDINAIKYLVAPYIARYNPAVSFGLCHGTRRGLEQQAFIDGLIGKNATVIGTEIAPGASKKYSNTIEWDFHNVKDEWNGNVDFIYSNALDHSYKPEECLDAWMSCLNEKGLCIIEWTPAHGESASSKLDPYGASYEEYIQMLRKKYQLVDTIAILASSKYAATIFRHRRRYLIIKNK